MIERRELQPGDLVVLTTWRNDNVPESVTEVTMDNPSRCRHSGQVATVLEAPRLASDANIWPAGAVICQVQFRCCGCRGYLLRDRLVRLPDGELDAEIAASLELGSAVR